MISRLQGTDGIRRQVKLSTDLMVKGEDPLQIFLEKDIITEEFFELYSFCYVLDLIERERMIPGNNIVVGWDPRDKEGIFTDAVLSGVQKAGGSVISIGVVPTPLVPLYMIKQKAKGGIMVTASHNPPDQNGIKLFISGTGLKPLPFDDERLSKKIFNTKYAEIKKIKPVFGISDASLDAINFFKTFSLDPQNSWVNKETDFSNTLLIVDPANGSFSSIAADIFSKAGFQVIEVSADLNGEVNRESGVVEIEGLKYITSDQIENGALFSKNRAINELFLNGRKLKKEIQNGEKRVCGAIFDCDGDRFIRIDYDPFNDRIIVLSGDEIAFHQAAYLMAKHKYSAKEFIYVNTVESDLNASVFSEKLGFTPVITGVGDKWILLEAAFSTLKASKWDNESILKLRRREHLSSEEVSDYLLQTSPEFHEIPFGIGAEESGHAITAGVLKHETGVSMPVFSGNGLKSAINCFVSTSHLYGNYDSALYFKAIEKPFEPGFKKTLYIYYVKKEKLSRSNPLRANLELKIQEGVQHIFGDSFKIKIAEKNEEPDMIYFALYKEESLVAAIYVRNSGTEDKTGINLRGLIKYEKNLLEAGNWISNFLIHKIKDREKLHARAELSVLKLILKDGVVTLKSLSAIYLNVSVTRLIKEMEKQRLILKKEDLLYLTEEGRIFLAEMVE